ncbi:glycosyltransferase [Phycicoccus sp. 3266]|uniref:glycosyltransferase n=1 Tax=Phycicoccus sp. 3266 TaxID=2817751 RepID=UPI002861530B|nr:glycosyltransferase [Phycicoccus sp. 3266]MDR6864137.1 glycosyltransferase involved in cell wall biosynthesis [Phycicoccus sp. 3266]
MVLQRLRRRVSASPDAPVATDTRAVLVLGLPPYAGSHRAGKVARSFAAADMLTTYLGLSAAGRSTPAGEVGRWTSGRVNVVQVRIRALRAAGPVVAWRNLACSYLPALGRLAAETIRTPASVVHVNGLSLLPLGLLHRVRYGSRVLLDVDERPASGQLAGSVNRILRPLELPILRLSAKWVDTIVSVCESHRTVLRGATSRPLHLVIRNVPEASTRGTYQPPASCRGGEVEVVFTCVGSVFEGRGFETLIEACALVQDRMTNIKVVAVGYGRPEYIRYLRELAVKYGAATTFQLRDPVPRGAVHEVYARAHVGLALYDPTLAHNASLPNKVLEAVSIGRPVLSAGQDETAAFLTHTRTGWSTTYSPHDIADAMLTIERALRLGRPSIEEWSLRCRELGDAELTWESEFLPLLQRLRHESTARDGVAIG